MSTKEPSKQLVRVAAAIFIKDEMILAGRRASHKESAGQWEFPGGKIERTESDFDAVRREIKEEMGFIPKPIWRFDISSTEVDNKTIKLVSIVCEIGPIGNLQSTDHDQFRWLSRSELAQILWAKPDLQVVRKLQEHRSWAELLNREPDAEALI